MIVRDIPLKKLDAMQIYALLFPPLLLKLHPFNLACAKLLLQLTKRSNHKYHFLFQTLVPLVILLFELENVNLQRLNLV